MVFGELGLNFCGMGGFLADFRRFGAFRGCVRGFGDWWLGVRLCKGFRGVFGCGLGLSWG